MKTLWSRDGRLMPISPLIPLCVCVCLPSDPRLQLLYQTETCPQCSHAAPHGTYQCVYLYPVSADMSSFFFFPSSSSSFFGFYLDRKTPEVFLVGNSWRGMLLREQGVRVESRFSGSGLTPCSAIPSRPRCHDRPVVSGLAAALGNSRLISFSRILRFWLYTAPALASTPALFLLLSTVSISPFFVLVNYVSCSLAGKTFHPEQHFYIQTFSS